MSQPDYSAVLGRLQKVRRLRGKTWQWIACCPAHNDRSPSLGLKIGENGCLFARCLANHGCTFHGIVAATGTRPQDWFPPKEDQHKQGGRMSNPTQPQRKAIKTYPYQDESGQLLYEVVRYEPKDFAICRPDGKGGRIWNLEGVERVLYQLPLIIGSAVWETVPPVIVVEGEKDADRLVAMGYVATTNSGGAGKWAYDLGRALKGRRVAIISDNDVPGHAHACQVAGSLIYWGASSVRIVHLPGLPEKGDVSDWLDSGMPWTGEKPPDSEMRRPLNEYLRSAAEWKPTYPICAEAAARSKAA